MSALKTQNAQEPQNSSERYSEVAPLILSERDSTAVVNSIRYPKKPNDFLKETMHKHRAESGS